VIEARVEGNDDTWASTWGGQEHRHRVRRHRPGCDGPRRRARSGAGRL